MTGKSSSFPLTRLASKYVESTQDGRVLSNRAAIDIIDDRITTLLERVDFEEAPDRVANLYSLWKKYIDLRSEGKTTEASIVSQDIDDEFDKIYHDYNAWNQIFNALDIRRKHVESEVKVLKEIHAVLTAEDAAELVAKLMAAVIRSVDDPKTLRQIQYEFASITGDVSDDARKRGEDDS